MTQFNNYTVFLGRRGHPVILLILKGWKIDFELTW